MGDLQQYAEDLATGVTESSSSQQRAPQDAKTTHKTNNPNTMHAGPQQDALAIAQNGGLSAHDADDGNLDGDTEVDMDDDMMDKISSSPSIEDGGSPPLILPPLTSHGRDARSRVPSPFPGSQSASPVISEARSSSPYPYLARPEHLPLYRQDQQPDVVHPTPPVCHHHLSGKYPAQGPTDRLQLSSSQDSITAMYGDDAYEPLPQIGRSRSRLVEAMTDDWGEDNWEPRTKRYRPDNYQPSREGPGVFYPPRYAPSPRPGPGPGPSPIPHGADSYSDYDDSELTVPYEYESDEEDDDGDFSSLDDSRFLDSGWGGECLQDTEDIDFELVYALHTFVATVDGQANATKGDAMVLLDDSNSYWWLVRVVKDASIGTFYVPEM